MKFLFKRESSAVDWQRQWERDRARSRVFQKFMRQKKANSMQGLSAGCPWGFCLSCGNGKDGQNWEGVTLSRGRSVWCFVHDCGVQVSLPGTLTLKLRKVEWNLLLGTNSPVWLIHLSWVIWCGQRGWITSLAINFILSFDIVISFLCSAPKFMFSVNNLSRVRFVEHWRGKKQEEDKEKSFNSWLKNIIFRIL
jgi:hypothetical protein